MKRAGALKSTLLPVLALTILVCLLSQVLFPASALAYEDQLPEMDYERALPGDPDVPHGIIGSEFNRTQEESALDRGMILDALARWLLLLI